MLPVAPPAPPPVMAVDDSLSGRAADGARPAGHGNLLLDSWLLEEQAIPTDAVAAPFSFSFSFQRRRRHRLWIVLGALAVTVATLLVVWGVLQSRDGRVILDLHEPGCTIRVTDSAGNLVPTHEFQPPEYSLRLPPGRYRVEISKPGFQTWWQEVNLTAGQKARHFVQLTPTPPPGSR
jgi:hypothetical protein